MIEIIEPRIVNYNDIIIVEDRNIQDNRRVYPLTIALPISYDHIIFVNTNETRDLNMKKSIYMCIIETIIISCVSGLIYFSIYKYVS